jgi:hypothetical protein
MAEKELVDAYTSGAVSRRAFIRRLVAGGLAIAAASAAADALTPSIASAGTKPNSIAFGGTKSNPITSGGSKPNFEEFFDEFGQRYPKLEEFLDRSGYLGEDS